MCENIILLLNLFVYLLPNFYSISCLSKFVNIMVVLYFKFDGESLYLMLNILSPFEIKING